MKKLTTILLSGLFGLPLLAANPAYSFTYQARILDERGEVVKSEDGVTVKRNHVVTLRLYDKPTGGALLWGQTYSIFTDERGLFNLEVNDDISPLNASEGALYSTLEETLTNPKTTAGGVYIGLTVKGSAGEIVPRQRLFAVPFAAVANDVRKISGDIAVGGNITLGGKDKGLVISSAGITQKGDSSIDAQKVTSATTISAAGTIEAKGGLKVTGADATFGVDVEIDASKKLTKGGVEILPVPVGGIIMWTRPELPDKTHWAICDGQTANNIVTPDLRGRFIVGVNNGTTGTNPERYTYSYGDKSGEEKHALSLKEMPSHYHLHFGDDHLDYKATVERREKGYDADSDDSGNSGWFRTTSAGGDPSTGATVAHENRPPYYALYYIMRVK